VAAMHWTVSGIPPRLAFRVFCESFASLLRAFHHIFISIISADFLFALETKSLVIPAPVVQLTFVNFVASLMSLCEYFSRIFLICFSGTLLFRNSSWFKDSDECEPMNEWLQSAAHTC
jgi:hypothetical protein